MVLPIITVFAPMIMWVMFLVVRQLVQPLPIFPRALAVVRVVIALLLIVTTHMTVLFIIHALPAIGAIVTLLVLVPEDSVGQGYYFDFN